MDTALFGTSLLVVIVYLVISDFSFLPVVAVISFTSI